MFQITDRKVECTETEDTVKFEQGKWWEENK